MGQDKHHEPQVHEEQFELPDVSFDEFSIPTYEEWKTTVEGILKGKDFQKKYVYKNIRRNYFTTNVLVERPKRIDSKLNISWS